MEEEEDVLDDEELALEEETRARMTAEQDAERDQIGEKELGNDKEEIMGDRDRHQLHHPTHDNSSDSKKRPPNKLGRERGTPSPRYMDAPDHHQLPRSQSAVDSLRYLSTEELRERPAHTEHTLARSRQAWTGSVRKLLPVY